MEKTFENQDLEKASELISDKINEISKGRFVGVLRASIYEPDQMVAFITCELSDFDPKNGIYKSMIDNSKFSIGEFEYSMLGIDNVSEKKTCCYKVTISGIDK